MAMVEAVLTNDPMGIIKDMRTKTHKAHWAAMRKSIVRAEREHKKRFTKRGKGPVHDKLLTMRRGSAGLSGSYTRELIKNKLTAIYGSDKKYSAIHEFGGQAGRGRKVTIPARPGVEMTKKYMGPVMEKILADSLKKVGL